MFASANSLRKFGPFLSTETREAGILAALFLSVSKSSCGTRGPTRIENRSRSTWIAALWGGRGGGGGGRQEVEDGTEKKKVEERRGKLREEERN